MDDIQQQRSHFEHIAGKYYESRRHANHLLLKDLIWRFFLAGRDFGPAIRVIEPMCGYGEGKQILARYTKSRIEYTGFDFSETLVNQALETDPDANIFIQDVTRYEPGENRYDLIILLGGLHHVFRHAEAVIERLGQGLKTGGYFINFEPTHDNPVFKAIRSHIYRDNDLFDADTEQAFDLRDLNSMFLRNGFEIVDQIYPGLASYVLYYNPDAFPFLNVGGARMVRFLFGLDRLFFRSAIGRRLSFATLTLWRKRW